LRRDRCYRRCRDSSLTANTAMPVFCQLVIGPPGSGKTTFCNGMQQLMHALGRECVIVNLDPANDALPYPCALNVMDLISLEDVMDEFALGPNGGLVYCMEYLEKNIEWLDTKLNELDGMYDHMITG
jgi:GPN-loop GTPase